MDSDSSSGFFSRGLSSMVEPCTEDAIVTVRFRESPCFVTEGSPNLVWQRIANPSVN